MMLNILKTYQIDENGTTAVEFGLIALAFITMIFGVIEMGRAFMAWNSFQYSVENAARYALVNSDVTEQQLTDRIVAEMAGFNAAEEDIEIEVNFPVVSSVNFVEISGTYEFETLISFLPESWGSIQLSGVTRLPRP